MNGVRIKLGLKIFPSKQKAKTYVKELLSSLPIGDIECGEIESELKDLIRLHPSQDVKVSNGIAKFAVFGNGSGMRGKGFGFWDDDGNEVRFSYKCCLDRSLRPLEARVKEAFRKEVRIFVLRWRDNVLKAYPERLCQITGYKLSEVPVEVDHIIPFEDILVLFLKNEGVALYDVEVHIDHGENVEAMLHDRELALRWVRFHNGNVQLRLLSSEGHRIHHGNT